MAHNSPEFEKIILDGLLKWKVPGIAVAVIEGDEIKSKVVRCVSVLKAYSTQGYGLARLSGEKFTANTLVDCASNSKSLTAAAVALLVHDDDNHPDLKWTTPVSRILPDDFVLPDPYYTENITVEDILSHRSGMPGYVLQSCSGHV
jgi:CubicO group peptidase (beta-lactamase class C family)